MGSGDTPIPVGSGGVGYVGGVGGVGGVGDVGDVGGGGGQKGLQETVVSMSPETKKSLRKNME